MTRGLLTSMALAVSHTSNPPAHHGKIRGLPLAAKFRMIIPMDITSAPKARRPRPAATKADETYRGVRLPTIPRPARFTAKEVRRAVDAAIAKRIDVFADKI